MRHICRLSGNTFSAGGVGAGFGNGQSYQLLSSPLKPADNLIRGEEHPGQLFRGEAVIFLPSVEKHKYEYRRTLNTHPYIKFDENSFSGKIKVNGILEDNNWCWL